MRIKRLNDLRCGERLLKTFNYLQQGTKSTDLLKYIMLDKFSISFFFRFLWNNNPLLQCISFTLG